MTHTPRPTVSIWWRTASLVLLVACVAASNFLRPPRNNLPVAVRTLHPPPHDPRWFKTLPGNEFRNATYPQVFAWISRESGLPISYRPGLLSDTDTSNFSVERVTVGDALQGVLPGGPNFVKMLAIERSDTIEILPISEALSTRVYDIRPLLKLHHSNAKQPVNSGTQSIFGFGPSYTDESEDLVSLVTNIDAANWRCNGGSISEISAFAGLLMIKTTDENHRQIAALLSALQTE